MCDFKETILTTLEQAIGVIPGKDGGVTLLIKKADKHHQPASAIQTTTFGPSRSTRKYVFLDPRFSSTHHTDVLYYRAAG
jgi:hypothetical protein